MFLARMRAGSVGRAGDSRPVSRNRAPRLRRVPSPRIPARTPDRGRAGGIRRGCASGCRSRRSTRRARSQAQARRHHAAARPGTQACRRRGIRPGTAPRRHDRDRVVLRVPRGIRPCASSFAASCAHSGAPGAGYCSVYSGAGKPAKLWRVSGAGLLPTRTPGVCQCGDTTSTAATSGSDSPSARRFAPSRPGSSANIGEPWEMETDGGGDHEAGRESPRISAGV